MGLREKFSASKKLTLRSRLILLLLSLMLVGVLFSGYVLYRQHAIAERGTDIAIQAHDATVRASQMREALAEIDRYSVLGEINQQEVDRFTRLLTTFYRDPQFTGSTDKLDTLHVQFASYISALRNSSTSEDVVRARYGDVSSGVSLLLSTNEDFVYRMSERLQQQQQQARDLAIIFMLAWFALIMIAGSKIISILVGPLTSLATFLDHINVEDDLPATLPSLDSDAPEFISVAKSFERVMLRLRGYRHLNVRRLLIEKRQADIISASILDGIFLLRDEEILFLNPVAERILGLVGGHPQRGIKLRALAERDREANHQLPAAQRKSSGATSVLGAISQTIPVEFTMPGEERKFSYLITAYPISYDVVEQIEHSVSAPVDQILERFQANIMVVARDITLVRESQEAKSHFLGTLSHEVKTPVTSLTMATRLLKKTIDQVPNPMHRNLITTCAEDVDRLRKLLEDLLTVSRFDTLTQRLEMQSIDFVKLVKHAVQSFQVQASERGVELIYRTLNTATPLVVAMDPSKVTWALSNLLTNALRHTPRGGKVSVTVETPSLEAGGEDVVEVRIRDTGPGIDRVRQEKIFDKFNPFYDIRVARSGGAGVGLAIAREIVVAHGGKIWLSSEPGNGAEFCFTLPRKTGPAALRTSVTSAGEGEAAPAKDSITKGALSGGTSARS